MPSKFRKADINWADKPGTVYLLHFSRPYKHCRHYIGFTERPVDARFAQHLNGHGSALTAAAEARGITFEIARTWDNVDQSLEFILKSRGESRKLCPICSGNHALEIAIYEHSPLQPAGFVEDNSIPF